MDKTTTQLVVIGGGPGGYAAAFYAADIGLDVTLIDREKNPGGVCLYRGCIPSKALLHVAKLIRETRESAEWGVTFSEPKIDLDKLRAWKESVVAKMTGGLGTLSKQRKITFIQGTASFVDANTLQISGENGEQTLAFEHAIIATGSRPTRIPGLSIDSPRVMNSTAALALEDIPGSLLVIGGGYIGLELGSVYSALGSQVTVVEMMPSLLPGADKDLVTVLSKELKKSLHKIYLNTRVAELRDTGTGIEVKLEGDKVDEPVQNFDKVLIAVGRTPNNSGFGLENTGIGLDEKGFIPVNEKRQTAVAHIYAIGDIAGEPMLAHKASHEARVAVDAILGKKVAFEPNAIPAVVFTDPEVAWCGLTENEAKAQGITVEVARFPWAASGRATTLGRSDGVTKLIIDPETQRVLGVGIAGPGAGELISEGVLAVEMAALASDVALSIHPHPTLAETVMEAAEMFYGHSTHVYRPKRKK